MLQEPGKNQYSSGNNITEAKRVTGTSRAYTLSVHQATIKQPLAELPTCYTGGTICCLGCCLGKPETRKVVAVARIERATRGL